MKRFDRRFAPVMESVPTTPGVYRFYDDKDFLIYVGKAKNLRRRLAQYRNARRCKAHAKMRKIVQEAVRLEFETCTDEVSSLRLEMQLIQKHRPRWNVAGAFFFLYPMLGVKLESGELFLCYTTQPGNFPGFDFHGAFRSRRRTREGFFALNTLLRLIGHPYALPELMQRGYPRNSRQTGYVYGFRQIPPSFFPLLDSFFRGEDFTAIEELALLLLDRPTAVRRSRETEELLKDIRRFWKHEVLPLRRARLRSGHAAYPVSQQDRDFLFIDSRYVASAEVSKVSTAEKPDHRSLATQSEKT